MCIFYSYFCEQYSMQQSIDFGWLSQRFRNAFIYWKQLQFVVFTDKPPSTKKVAWSNRDA